MTLLPQQRDELYGYINALCEEQLDEVGRQRLEEMLVASEEAQWLYIFEMNLHANLVLDHRCEPDEVAVVESSAEPDLSPLPVTSPSPPPVSPVLGFLGGAYHGTIGFFSQEVPFSLLVATFVTGLGLLAGSLVYVSQPKSMAKNVPAPMMPAVAVLRPERELVGRITGAVDVKWAEGSQGRCQGTEARDTNQKFLVSLGDKFLLSSGLLEITYDSGTKVILQGPVTYEVDSRDGGFLSVGRLTARVEKKGPAVRDQWSEKVARGPWPVASENNLPSPASGRGVGGEGGQQTETANQKLEIINRKSLVSSLQPLAPNANPQSLIPNPSVSPAPTFAVRTPTAVVTDLGTEFGIEVDRQGNTASYVFQGTVQVRGIGHDGSSETSRILHADQFVSAQRDSQGSAVLLNPSKISPEFFVRPEQFQQLVRKQQQPQADRWREYVAKIHRDSSLVVHYDFQRPAQTPNTLRAYAPHAKGNLDGVIELASERGFAAIRNTHDNLLSGRLVEVSSTYFDDPGWAKTHLIDGTNASHVFADSDASQRLVIHGFNSPVKVIRIWRAFDRIAQDVTIRASRSDLTSLTAADYEISLAAKSSLVFNSDCYTDIRVEAPPGTQSLFFDFGDRSEYYPAGGWDHPAGVRTDEIQAFAGMPPIPRFSYESESLWSIGRMPGTTALQFNGVDSCVRVHLPQQFTQMTLAAWVTVDFINDQYKSCGLLMSDRWAKEGVASEKCHWQILRTGKIMFGTEENNAESSTALPWQHWGRNRWRHLAATTDPVQGQIALYLDGKQIHAEKLSKKFTAVFGDAMIGNWVSDSGKIERGFCGRMDDLMILSRAMTTQEIKELYEAGKP